MAGIQRQRRPIVAGGPGRGRAMTDPITQYLDDLVIHLRLRGVSGDEIGAILEETRDHLEESGEDPREAFGPVAVYGRDLARAKGWRDRPCGWTRKEFALAAINLVSWFLVVRAGVAWGLGEPARITLGMLLGLVSGLAVAAWVVWPTVVAYATRKAGLWLPVVCTVAAVAVVVLVIRIGESKVWGNPVLVAWSAPAVAVSALVVLIVTIVPLIRHPDPIRRPGS